MKLILAKSSRFVPVEIVSFENVAILLVAVRTFVQFVVERPLVERQVIGLVMKQMETNFSSFIAMENCH